MSARAQLLPISFEASSNEFVTRDYRAITASLDPVAGTTHVSENDPEIALIL